MKKLENYQIIIIGAGLSGLTLAKEICARSNYKILILEKKKKLVYDKNWCFWNQPINTFTHNFDNAWEKISISIDDKEKIFFDKKIKYLHIKSTTFYKKFINDLKKKNVKIKMNQNINEILYENNWKLVKSNNSIFKSKIVFDSRPQKYSNKKNLLYQHFYGVEILLENSLLDKNKVTLMDFQTFNNGIHFFYVLPFSAKKALVETTYFSTNVLEESIYKSDIRKYLKKKFPNEKYKIKFKEKGIIPMFHDYNNNIKNDLINIGTRGNWVRASTGYSFQNSFLNAKDITEKLIHKKKLNISSNKKIRFLDKIFCYYIANYSNDSKEFFKCFFFKNKFRNIVSFLIGDINLLRMLVIILSLPKKKLLYSMFKTIIHNKK